MQSGHTAEQSGGAPLKGHCQSLLASLEGHSFLLGAQRQAWHHQRKRGQAVPPHLGSASVHAVRTPSDPGCLPSGLRREGKKKAGRQGRGRRG